MLMLCALGTVAVAAQAPANRTDDAGGVREPQIDSTTLQRGRELFGPQCGFCHGQDARGTGAGPDLARSLVILTDENGKELGEFLQLGRPAAGMPSFPNLSRPQLTDIATFLHDRVQASLARDVVQVAVGDAARGRRYFEGAGRCTSCHSASGDLKEIATNYDPITLTDKIVNPRTSGGRGRTTDPYPRRVLVKLVGGKTVSGILEYVNEFAVTLRDSGGRRMSFRRDGEVPQVEIVDPLQSHQDLLPKLADNDLHDLTAYLMTLK
jgi:cytochrome c oxidase cbb3-type subunit III